jgi:hypothetical protein
MCHSLTFILSFDAFLGPKGTLPDLKNIWSIHDFEGAARNYLNATAYTWIRHGGGGEYTYRNNLEVYPKLGFRPRMLTGPSHVNTTLKYSCLPDSLYTCS